MNVMKTGMCYVLAVFFMLAGVLHFVKGDVFAAIVPPILPFPLIIVWITGVIELVLAVGLIWPKYRRRAGFWFAPYLLAVLPANIYMALEGIPLGTHITSPTALWVRVVLQFPLILLILWASGHFTRSPQS